MHSSQNQLKCFDASGLITVIPWKDGLTIKEVDEDNVRVYKSDDARSYRTFRRVEQYFVTIVKGETRLTLHESFGRELEA